MYVARKKKSYVCYVISYVLHSIGEWMVIVCIQVLFKKLIYFSIDLSTYLIERSGAWIKITPLTKTSREKVKH